MQNKQAVFQLHKSNTSGHWFTNLMHESIYLFQMAKVLGTRGAPSTMIPGSSHLGLKSPSPPSQWPSPPQWHPLSHAQTLKGSFGSRPPCWRAVWASLLSASQCMPGRSIPRGKGPAYHSLDQCTECWAPPDGEECTCRHTASIQSNRAVKDSTPRQLQVHHSHYIYKVWGNWSGGLLVVLALEWLLRTMVGHVCHKNSEGKVEISCLTHAQREKKAGAVHKYLCWLATPTNH